MLKQHLSLRIWSIQGAFSTRCFECAKTQCTQSTCFNIALSASYTQDEVTSLNKLHMEHVDCFPIPCNSLCHSKIHVIYIYIYISKSTTHPWILKSLKNWYSKILKNPHADPSSHGPKCLRKSCYLLFFSNLILLSFELKEAKPLTFLRSFNILS